MTRRIDVVVFDLGGVVCRYLPERRLDELAAATKLTGSDVEEAIHGSGLDAAADRGELDLAGNVAAVRAALGRRLPFERLLEIWASAFELDPDVVALARRLDRRTAILTDNGPLLEECRNRGLLRIAEPFDPILMSWRLGACKPDPVVFERAARALGSPPDRLLLIDDSAANVRGARDAGWQALLHTDPAELERRLARFMGA